MELFKIFKKKPVEPEVIIEKENVYSRFTFAHENVNVYKYYLDTHVKTEYRELAEKTVFTINPHTVDNTGRLIYPIFRMPAELPKRGVVNPKKVICIGTLIVDDMSSEIMYIWNEHTGMTMEEINNEFGIDKLTGKSNVVVMNYSDVIKSRIVSGEIDYLTFEQFITIKNRLHDILNG